MWKMRTHEKDLLCRCSGAGQKTFLAGGKMESFMDRQFEVEKLKILWSR